MHLLHESLEYTQKHGEEFSNISDHAGLMEDFREVQQVDVLLVRFIIHCIAPSGLRFLPFLCFESFPATKVQAQEPRRAELRSDARDVENDRRNSGGTLRQKFNLIGILTNGQMD